MGLPRTGTTLAEQILGSHSQVHAAGEALALSEAISAALERKTRVGALDWLGFADSLGGLDGEPIAREYLARLQIRRGSKPRFVDKQTLNFNYCALIFRAFPQARVVNSRNRGFAHGNNRGMETTTARYVLFLNPDTQVVDGTFGDLVATLEAWLVRNAGLAEKLTGSPDACPIWDEVTVAYLLGRDLANSTAWPGWNARNEYKALRDQTEAQRRK